MVDVATAEQLAELYASWDFDRSKGKSVAVGITDATFGPAIQSQATFSTAPRS